MEEVFYLKGGYNSIKGILSLPSNGNGPFSCVILSHGLISSKDGSKYVLMSRIFAENGIAVVRFDYHGCGESEGLIEETSLSIRLENMERVFKYVIDHNSLDNEKIGLFGSSFGGVVSIIKAARDRRVKGIAILSTPIRMKREIKFEQIEFSKRFYEDFLSYDILDEARHISNVLLLHGEKDEVVPLEEGKKLFSFFREPKEMKIIKDADHRVSDPLHREELVHLCLMWFRTLFVSS